MPYYLGIDTSNYTTSAAVFDSSTGCVVHKKKLLPVAEGALGLKQSDAVFAHVKQLPQILEELFFAVPQAQNQLAAVGVSVRPRNAQDSYMPCFLAGESQGKAMASVLEVPFYACSHQQGHIAAAAWSAGRMDLLDQPHLVWHLSGGTTELLYVVPDGAMVQATCIGGTSDISAGQLIDRTGKKLGLPFPAGKAVDELSLQARDKTHFRVKVSDCTFSFSGIENKMNALAEGGTPPAEVCWYVLSSIIQGVETATQQALVRYPGLPVLCAGGVASNQLLRQRMTKACGAVFAEPRFSTDNAMGVAILTWRIHSKEGL